MSLINNPVTSSNGDGSADELESEEMNVANTVRKILFLKKISTGHVTVIFVSHVFKFRHKQAWVYYLVSN